MKGAENDTGKRFGCPTSEPSLEISMTKVCAPFNAVLMLN